MSAAQTTFAEGTTILLVAKYPQHTDRDRIEALRAEAERTAAALEAKGHRVVVSVVPEHFSYMAWQFTPETPQEPVVVTLPAVPS